MEILILGQKKKEIGEAIGNYKPSTFAVKFSFFAYQVIQEFIEEAPERFGMLGSWETFGEKIGFERMKM